MQQEVYILTDGILQTHRSSMKEVWKEILAGVPKRVPITMIGILIVIMMGMSYLSWYSQDNMVEEVIEEVLEDKSGLQVDLSPNSKEPSSLR